MRIGTLPRGQGEVPLALLFGSCALLACAAARILLILPDRLLTIPIFCPFKALTGLPCLTCGGTRALGALARGDFLRALSWNPLVALTTLTVLALALASLWRRVTGRPSLRLVLSHGEQIALRGAAVAAALANWAYLIARG